MPGKEKNQQASTAGPVEAVKEIEKNHLPPNDPDAVNEAAQQAEQAVIDAVKGVANAVESMKSH